MAMCTELNKTCLSQTCVTDGTSRTAHYLKTSSRGTSKWLSKSHLWKAPEDLYRFITSRKATCCAQLHCNIKARFCNSVRGTMLLVGFAFWERNGSRYTVLRSRGAREEGRRAVVRCGIYRGERRVKGERGRGKSKGEMKRRKE